MVKPLSYLLLSAACALASCQPTAPTTATPPAATAPTATGAATAAEARAAVGQYLQTQPAPALFVLDSARVNDNGPSWQVLVPRTDWAKRMPNSAHFEVDKATGKVSTGLVK
jgi:hypothetical protein